VRLFCPTGQAIFGFSKNHVEIASSSAMTIHPDLVAL
jgi:hypothetical protein